MKKTFKAFMLVLMSASFLAFTSCTPKDEPTPVNPTPDNPTPVNPTPDNPTPDTPTSGDSWAYLINETPHEAVVNGNTLTYGDHSYTVSGEFDFNTPVSGQLTQPTAFVTFTNIPSGYTEFEAVYNNLLGKSIQGTAAMIPMAMEIYARNADLGERCFKLICNSDATVAGIVRILKTKFNYSPYSPENDTYVQRYLPAVTLKGAAWDNGYNPTEPYTMEMCRHANDPQPTTSSGNGTDYFIYILVDPDHGGWDTFQRGVEIWQPMGSDMYKVWNCPNMYVQCKPIYGTWRGLK